MDYLTRAPYEDCHVISVQVSPNL